MTKSILGWSAAICLLAGCAAPRASADITYDLVGVKLYLKDSQGNIDYTKQAGSLTGTFSTSNDLKTVTSLAITASADPTHYPGLPGFSEVKYTLDNNWIFQWTPSTTLYEAKYFPSSGLTATLQLVFAGGLTPTGAALVAGGVAGGSWENQNFSNDRYVGAGSVVAQGTAPPVAAVPEPSAVAVVAICAPALLVYAQRRRRKGTDAA